MTCRQESGYQRRAVSSVPLRGLKAKDVKVIIDSSDVRSEWRFVEVSILRVMVMGKRRRMARNQELALW